MREVLPPLLSQVLAEQAEPSKAGEVSSPNRRQFITRASRLGLLLPVAGAALEACYQDESSKAASKPPVREDSSAAAGVSPVHQNPDSRSDTALHTPHTASSATAPAVAGASSTIFHRFDPALPPLGSSRALSLHWKTKEVPIRISPSTVVAGWTFEGDIPGPIVHCRVGDTIDFTLTVEGAVPHSMDFHAAQLDPKTAFRSVAPGQSHSFTFRPKYAGAFLYHCGTAPVLMHIGSGMFGAIVVDPLEPLPPAKEFVLLQNEYYLSPAANGVQASDYTKMLAMMPDLVCFNGRPNQYQDAPIRVKLGDRVRFYVVSAGPSYPCNFHIVGEQFDSVYLGAPPGSPLHGVQTFSVAPGGGMVFELVADVAGEFPFVNHGFGHGQKGAIGVLVVE
ncbi:MAG: multicopper oxidase domain-containing protein [Gemmatimonadaceae bacterium]|nr:multicopper oxidase domain-containing protein [Gemmatimonadaceae bacterium]